MGLIEQEIKELRKDLNDFRQGKIKVDEFQARIGAYNQIEKRMKLMLQAVGLYAKYGKKAWDKLANPNLIGGGYFIDTSHGDPKNEEIDCPLLNQIIIREKCLSLSGDAKNLDTCQPCPNNAVTRKLLFSLPEYQNVSEG